MIENLAIALAGFSFGLLIGCILMQNALARLNAKWQEVTDDNVVMVRKAIKEAHAAGLAGQQIDINVTSPRIREQEATQ